MLELKYTEKNKKNTQKTKARVISWCRIHIFRFFLCEKINALTAAIKEGGGPPSPPSASPSLTTPFLCYPPSPHPPPPSNRQLHLLIQFHIRPSATLHFPPPSLPPSPPSRTAPPFPLMGGVHPASSCNLAGPEEGVTSLARERKQDNGYFLLQQLPGKR